MIHRPQTTKELIGQIEVMAKLYEAWEGLTRMFNKTLKIHKEDWGMDRDREMLIHRAKGNIMKARELVEQVLQLFKKDIEAMT